MTGKDVVVLEWTFTPTDYFESEVQLERDGYNLLIGSGKVEAQIEPELYTKNPNMRDELHRALNSRFMGVQLLTHKPYELSDASMYRLHPDGRRDITIFAKPGVFKLTGGTADFVIRDQDGNVISDTKSDRVKRKGTLAEIVEKNFGNDPTVRSVLDSYQAAVKDPDNELVHLYEIIDALRTKFGGERSACKELGVGSQEWARLRKLANSEPLRQGRHRGLNPGSLRDATKEELNEARETARHLIETYLQYLERRRAAG